MSNRYFSGRVKRTPQDQLREDRYKYLDLEQAEPNLGDPVEMTYHDVTDATYDPVSGDLELTLGAGHGLTVGNTLGVVGAALTFKCNYNGDNFQTEKSYPRSSGSPNTPTGADYLYNTVVGISAVTATTVTINANAGGPISDLSTHQWFGQTAYNAVYSGSYNKPTPIGNQYQIVSVPGFPGERFWVPIGGGTTPGALSIYDEGILIGTASHISEIDFRGAPVTATALPNQNRATVRITPATISTNPPTNPYQGELWWESDTGDLMIWYQDGTSGQWVVANSGGGNLNAGPKGDKGDVGDKGNQGLTGSEGDKGIKGEPSTVVGPKGDSGEKGQKGLDGDGDKGQKGDKGDIGQKGLDGDKGFDGTKGDKGEPDGQKGQKGLGGDKGNKGDDNSTKGEKGDQNDKGQKGEDGASASKGDKGEKGQKGEVGDKGQKGDVEQQGNKGDKGEKGDFKGQKGEVGDKGLKGDVEQKGVKGGEGEKGQKGEKGEVEAQGNKGQKGQQGDKGQKGEIGVGEKGQKGEDNSTKGDKGEKGDFKGEKGQDGQKGDDGDVQAKGAKGEPSDEKGQKGEKGDVEAKGAKGEPSDVKGQKGEIGVGDKGQKGLDGDGDKGQKGEPGADNSTKGQKGEDGAGQKGQKGDDGDVQTKGAKGEPGEGQKGEPGTGGATPVPNIDDYVLTATGTSVIQAESKLRFDSQGKLNIDAGTGDTHIEMGAGANNQYTYLDLIGDTTYTDFGFRFLRGNTGANTGSSIVHRGTGDLQLYAQDGGGCSLTANDFRIRNDFRSNAGPSNNSLSGTSTSGMRFLTNFYSGWAYNQSGYAIDSGISVNQYDGLGAIIVIHSHTASATQHSAGLYFIRLSYSQSAITVTTIHSGGFLGASFGVSSQGTLTMTGSKGGNYFNLIGVGNIMV